MSEFINAALADMGVTIGATRIPNRTDGNGGEWDRGCSHYRVNVTNKGETAFFEYSMGSAHKSGPDAAGLVHALRLDAEIGGMSYDEYVGEFGAPDVDDRESIARIRHILRMCKSANSAYKRLFTREERETFNELFSEY